MTDFLVRFAERLAFSHNENPLVMVTISANGQAFEYEAHVDTGAERTIFWGYLLEPLGWQQLPEEDGGAKSFRGATGNQVWASSLEDAELSLPTGDSFQLTIWGSHERLERNLIGRDLLRRGVFGFDLELQHLSVSSLRDNDRSWIFPTSSNPP